MRLGMFLMTALALSAAESARDAKAETIAQEMMKEMGGQDVWNKAHFVRFDFKVTNGPQVLVERSHLWDKQTGRYRLETKTKDGKSRVVLFNLATKNGTVYDDGKPLDASASNKDREDAYGAWVNDMYWLAMPWKWMDGGVHLKMLPPQKCGTEQCDVVELSFDHVGLTPGDRYKAFVSQKSHMMVHWEYKLQGGNEGAWDWEYVKTGGVKLAANHVDGKGRKIDMGAVQVLDKVEDAYFTDPKRSLAALK